MFDFASRWSKWRIEAAVRLPVGRLTKLIASAYYAYEWFIFEKRFRKDLPQKEVANAKIAFDGPKVAGYLARLPSGAAPSSAEAKYVGEEKHSQIRLPRAEQEGQHLLTRPSSH